MYIKYSKILKNDVNMINLVKKVFRKVMNHLVLTYKIFFLVFCKISNKKKGPYLFLKIRVTLEEIYNHKDLEFFHAQ